VADEHHPLSVIANNALLYGAALRHLKVGNLAARLYGYNRLPHSSQWRSLEAEAAFKTWLGLDVSSVLARLLERDYFPVSQGESSRYWLQWRRPVVTGTLCHKLYVSPLPRYMPSTIKVVAETCCAMGIPSFKVGLGALGVLRPDKLVLYFDNVVDRNTVADELAVTLKDVGAHGVPFTAPVDPAGLLSWGFDPGATMGSWRQMIAGVLAKGLHGAPDGTHAEIADFARRSLRLAQISPELWQPMAPDPV